MSTERPDLNEFARRCHEAAISWWQDPETGLPIERNPRELLMLAISEISECLEGERKNLMDDKLTHRKMPEVEMADFCIRLADFAGGFEIDLFPVRWDGIPENKGEALFHLCKMTGDCFTDSENIDSGVLSWLFAYAQCYCRTHGYDLWGAVEEKMAYNKSREDHRPENRLKEGGKRF